MPKSLLLALALVFCSSMSGCRRLAGYGPAQPDARGDTVADAAWEDSRADGPLDARGDGQRGDGPQDTISDLGRDAGVDLYSGDTVAYPDFGSCPCSGGLCPPPLGTECVMTCGAAKPCVCPVGYICRMACVVPGCQIDCRFAKKCISVCSTFKACSLPIYCGGQCEAYCSGPSSCPNITIVGGAISSLIWCSGPSSCAGAKIVGGAGPTTVSCTAASGCANANIDLSSSCGGRIECPTGACTAAQTTFPNSCAPANQCLSSSCACP